MSSAEYIMYLDGDDYIKENTVERVFQVMQEYPSDFVQFMYQEVEKGQNPPQQTEFVPIYQANTPKEIFENLYRLGGVAASGATKLFRRELMLQIPFENIRHEDEMWCTRAFQKPLTVTYIGDELYFYVMRQGSITHSRFNQRKLDQFRIQEARISALENCNLSGLIFYEYNRIFTTILTLYYEAKVVKDKDAMRNIQAKFFQHKSNIRQYAKLPCKFRILNRLMNLNFNFVNLYYIYCRVKHETD